MTEELFKFGGKDHTYEDLANYGVASAGEIKARHYLGYDTEFAALEPTSTFTDKVSSSFGLHVIVDAYGGNQVTLNDPKIIYEFLYSFPEEIGMTRISGPDVFEYSGVEPLDFGCSGVVTLAESHCSLHSFPARKGFMSFDVYSCKVFSPYQVISRLKHAFEFTSFEMKVIVRGHQFDRTTSGKDSNVSQPVLNRYVPGA